MKFVADGMLGKLTRWLRILGYDVEYSTDSDDAQLLSVAKEEKRVLLTRDLELYREAIGKGIEASYLEGPTGEEKLAELAERYNLSLDVDMSKSRCPKCNSRVRGIAKKDAQARVEENTFAGYSQFWTCPKCGQIYWQGAHWAGIRKKLARTNDIVEVIHKAKENRCSELETEKQKRE